MKKLAANLLTIFIACIVALLLAELATRLLLGAPQTIQVTATTPALPPPTDNKKTLSIQQHPDEGGVYLGTPTGRRLRPNRRITIENHRLSHQRVLIETNATGYRNPAVGEKHGKRILFLGDSITFQDYLNEDETFVRLVEKLAQQNNAGWETVNAAVGAISLETELAILQETGLGLKPDVVVLGFYLNDFQESRGLRIIHLPWLLQHSWFTYHLTEWFTQQRGKRLEETTLDIDAWKKIFEKDRKFSRGHFNESHEAFNQMILDAFPDYGAAWSDGAWQHMDPLFSELKRLSKKHSFKLVIVGFPVYQQVYTEFVDDKPQQQLRRIGKELDIPVLDLLPALRAEALRLRDPSIYHSQTFYGDLFYDQCHHTAAGSRLIANEIYNFLAALP